MNILARNDKEYPKAVFSFLFILGTLLLGTVLVVAYWSELLFTESHLVGYYCCITEQDLPQLGSVARAFSDFFRTPIGLNLPSLIFIGLTVGLFVYVWRYKRVKAWQMPFLFAGLAFMYVVAELAMVGVSWTISNAVLGIRTTPYAGYERTWYGISLHFLLWVVYFAALLKSQRFFRPQK